MENFSKIWALPVLGGWPAAGRPTPGLPRPLAVHRDPPAAPWPAPAAPALAPAPWRSRAAPLLGLIAGLTAAALAAVCWRGRRGGDAAAMAALASVRATQVTRNSAKALAQLLDKHQEPVAVKIEPWRGLEPPPKTGPQTSPMIAESIN